MQYISFSFIVHFCIDLIGYNGLVDEAQRYMRMDGTTAKDQQLMVKKVLETIAGPLAPIVYRTFMSPWPWAPFFTDIFTPFFFKFLVGPNKFDVREDGTPGGVYVKRCRFLEETNCKGLCMNMCKIPTQEFFAEQMGLDMTMSPNFETHECRLSFGLKAPNIDEDESIPKGCLNGCSSANYFVEQEMKEEHQRDKKENENFQVKRQIQACSKW